MHLAGTLSLSSAQATSAGKKSTNDDSYGLYVPEDSSLLATKGAAAIICDGVSAAEAGREAAEICARGFLDDYFGTPEQWSVETSAQKVLAALNRWLYGQGRRYQDAQRGYVCTLSACVLKSHTLHLFHVGDSRIYRLRSGQLTQLTCDHKLQVSGTTAYLSRAMGLDVSLTVDHRTLSAEPGDVYLMTTDGIHDFVSHADLWQAFAQRTTAAELQHAADALVALALAQGSDDNLTCQVFRIDALAPADSGSMQQALHALPFPPSLRVGSVLDGYKILSELHASPRSQVYLVRDTASSERYVMKTPSPNFDDDDAYIERFVLEQWIGSRVHSPHVARMLSPTRAPTCLYHLQEYVEGETLSQFMQRVTPREIRQALELVDQIARGLMALHRKETLHRDLKPDNVMIGKDGVVRLIDFGSCHVAGLGEIDAPIVRELVLGTATYAAPEALDGSGATVQADLFSLGVLAYELLTGALPYGDRVDEVRSAAQYARLRYTPAYHHNPLVPAWMDAALRKAVQVDARLRYRELSELVHDLTHPNPDFAALSPMPLVHKSPVRFWRTLTLCLALLEMGTVYYFAAQRTPRLDVDWKAVAPQGVSHGRIGTLPAR
jgi:serine/threonine protein kinase/serine/threonine protein phosphatase PrpC